MKNSVMSGHVITVARGSASVSGLPYDLGSGLIGVASGSYDANESGEYELSGVKEFDKRTADIYAVGAVIDWDDALNETVTDGDGASDFELGICIEAIGGVAGKVKVLVGGKPGPQN